MVVRVAGQAAASGALEVCVATDHEGIARAVTEHGFSAVMTRTDHVSGTDRVAEVVAQRGWAPDAVVVNVQGDEPLIDPQLIRAVAESLVGHPAASMATASHAIHERESMFNPAIVKVVTDQAGYALYFSRAPIPWARDAFASGADGAAVFAAQRHIGIYAYRADFLQSYARLLPAAIELSECLEQLRALWHGYRICVVSVEGAPAVGVDTPQDLEAVRAIFAANGVGNPR